MQVLPYLIAGFALFVAGFGLLFLFTGLIGLWATSGEEASWHYAKGLVRIGGTLAAIAAPVGWLVYRWAERNEDDRSGTKR